MNRLEKYIISNLSTIFLSIFLSLFSIASVIFLIKLATYTAIIQLTTLDMLKLYMFVIPELLFFTLPISFFVASALTVFKLSNDNEIVVIFALGIHPKFIFKTLLKPALLLSVLLMFNFFVLFPHAKNLSKNFITYKKSEAKFNLSASEFGHKFGNWLLYFGSKDTNATYSEVFLFNKNEAEEVLIGAKSASIINDSGILTLKLMNGEGYIYSKEKFSQIDFETMYINTTSHTNFKPYKKTLEYWLDEHKREKKTAMFITDILLSIFPTISLFLVLSISIVHARHQKSKIYLYLFLSVALYYGTTLGLQKIFGFYTIPIVSILWLLSTYIIYRKTIVTRF